jgi:hypothetical protein
MNKLPIYNIVLGDAAGILRMSLVESPAVDIDFQKFEKQHLSFSIDDEQHIVFGCALRADFPIYRCSPTMGEYYVVFTKETIQELYEKFMIDQRFNNVNLNHFENTDGVYLLQSFIKNTENGINPAGFEEIANGSWFTAYKVTNDEVWNKIKSGDLNGFSVEGFFDVTEPKDEIEDLVDELLK